jgi:hypothetical protein
MAEPGGPGSRRPKRTVISPAASPAEKKAYDIQQRRSWREQTVALNQEGEIVWGEHIASPLIVRCRRFAQEKPREVVS